MNSSKSKSSLALIEMLVAILLFSVTAAVCIQVFAKAYLMQSSAKQLTRACEKAQNVAELLESSTDANDSFALLMSTLPGTYEQENDMIALYMDDYFTSCPKTSEYASIKMEIRHTCEGRISYYNICIIDLALDKSIYSLDVACLH